MRKVEKSLYSYQFDEFVKNKRCKRCLERFVELIKVRKGIFYFKCRKCRAEWIE